MMLRKFSVVRNENQVTHQSQQTVVERKLLVFPNFSPLISNAEHHEQTHEVHGSIVHDGQKIADAKGSNQVFIGILCNAIEQIKDSTQHDNSHQALRTAANAADVGILCKSSR